MIGVKHGCSFDGKIIIILSTLRGALPWPTEVLFDVLLPSMGQEMTTSVAESDIAQHSSIDGRVGGQTRARLSMMRIITSIQRKTNGKVRSLLDI